MRTVTIYGASDDLIEVAGCPGADEFYAEGEGRDVIQGSFVLGGKMRIRALYDGCWSFAVGQVDEEIPLPDWPMRLRQSPDAAYSTLLEIDVPDDTALVREGKQC